MAALIFLAAAVFGQETFTPSPQPVPAPPAGSLPTESSPTENPPAATTETSTDSPAGTPETPTENPPTESAPIEVEPTFMLSEQSGTARFVQRLPWRKAQWAVRYSVVLERKREDLDVYEVVLMRNEDADTLFIDVSVPAGEYRYRVYSFNVVGQEDGRTNWEYFTIERAVQPSIFSFTPAAFFFDRATSRIIDLEGENLFPDTEVYLISHTLTDEAGAPFVIKPAEIYLYELGETCRMIFAEESLVAGTYSIVAKGRGGLETRAGTFSISMAKPYDINVSGGYTPNLTLFGMKDYFLDKVFIPVSFSLRTSFIFAKEKTGFIGGELSPVWTPLSSEKSGKKTSAQLLMINIGALYQYPLIPRKLFLNARAGLGLAGFFNYFFQYDNTGKNSQPMSTAAFSYNLGGSVQWFFFGQFFLEGGVDFMHIMHPEIPMGFVRVGLFGGYQF